MIIEVRARSIPFHLIIVFLLLSIGIVSVGYFFYQKEKGQVRKTGEESLTAIADLKVKQIKDWQSERGKDASFIFNNVQIADHRGDRRRGCYKKIQVI